MHISLTPTLEKMIQEELDNDLYATASELVREAVRDFLYKKKKARFHALIQEGIDAANRGEFSEKSFEEIIDEARQSVKA